MNVIKLLLAQDFVPSIKNTKSYIETTLLLRLMTERENEVPNFIKLKPVKSLYILSIKKLKGKY